MRRPSLTRRRIEGIQVLADRMELLLQDHAADLYPLTPEQKDRARRAVEYARDLSTWSRVRLKSSLPVETVATMYETREAAKGAK